MRLPPFHLHRPTSLPEAVSLAARYGDGAQYVAGGTDLIQHWKNRIYTPEHVISLQRIPGLRDISPTRIGALVTLTEIEESPVLHEHLPALPDATGHIASPIIRTTATIGGNMLVDTRCYYVNQSYEWRLSKGACLKSEGDVCLVVPNPGTCYATFSADLPALLIAWDASLHLVGPSGERDVALSEFYRYDGIARHIKEPAEVIAWIDIPEAAQGLTSGYSKLRVRDAFDYPEIGIAAALALDAQGLLGDLRLVVNAVEAVPKVFPDLCARAIGDHPTDGVIEAIAREVMEAVQPYRNTALAPGYRKQMVGVFTRRLLTQLRDQASAREA
ncbi:MAG TPA: FAD binding domain-containing protein [bacterium]|nr:FAD binding domain-containing protein [bacterium]